MRTHATLVPSRFGVDFCFSFLSSPNITKEERFPFFSSLKEGRTELCFRAIGERFPLPSSRISLYMSGMNNFYVSGEKSNETTPVGFVFYSSLVAIGM